MADMDAASIAVEGRAVRPTAAAAGASTTVPRRLRRILALDDLKVAARRLLPRSIFGFVAGGTETGSSLRENRAAFQDYDFLPRVLVDTSDRHQEKSLFGRRYAAPFGICPMGVASLAAHRADMVMALAAARANIPFALSASSLVRLEEV